MSEPTEKGLIHLEDDEVPTRSVVLLLLGTVAATVLSVLLARALFHQHERELKTSAEPAVLTPPDQVFHGLIAVERTGQRDAAEGEQTLAGYGWVDRERRVVRIPIERAIDLELAALTSDSTPRGNGR